jgi:predicted DNA-binding transcriptional regulator AlpA
MEAAGKAPPRVKITDRIVGYRDSDIKKFLDARTAA